MAKIVSKIKNLLKEKYISLKSEKLLCIFFLQNIPNPAISVFTLIYFSIPPSISHVHT